MGRQNRMRGRLEHVHSEKLEHRCLLSAVLPQDVNRTPLSLSAPTNLVALNDSVVFAYDDVRLGNELFISDGTSQGTHLLADIRPGRAGSSPAHLTKVGNYVYFSASDGITGQELWRTDGTATGTVPIADLDPTFDSELSDFIALPNGNVLFVAGARVFVTDGTRQGTVHLADTWTDPGSYTAGDPVLFDGVIYFQVTRSDYGGETSELWRSDGTAAGTVCVQRFAGIGPLRGLCVIGDRLFFNLAYKHVYTSDGSPGGARLLATVGNGGTTTGDVNTGGIAEGVAANGLYFFVASESSSGRELWAADANRAFRVKDLLSGTGSSSPEQLVVLNDKVYFTGLSSTFSSARRLGSSDGTDAGTAWVGNTTTTGSYPESLTSANGRLWYTAYKSSNYWLFSSDGTSAGTSTVRTMPEGNENLSSINYRSFVGAGNSVFFVATDEAIGVELWRTASVNPNASNTGPIKDLYPVTDSSNALLAGTVNNVAIYFAYDAVNGYEPRYTDGTSAISGLLKDIQATYSPYQYRNTLRAGITVGNYYYFASRDLDAGPYQLWRTDGTPGNTLPIGNKFGGEINSWFSLNGRIYLTMQGGGIIGSDGVGSLEGITSKAFYRASVIMNGVAYGQGYDAAGGVELWRTDGTAAGTYRVTDLVPGSGSSSPTKMTQMGECIYFFADSSENGRGLCKFDPSSGVTTFVKGVLPVITDDGMIAINGRLYFSSSDFDAAGSEPYVSDGTAAGTHILLDIVPGPGHSRPSDFVAFNGGAVFKAGLSTREDIWFTDGTEAGTRLMIPGAAGDQLRPVGDHLYYRSTTGSGYIWRTVGLSPTPELVSNLDVTQTLYTEESLFMVASDGVRGHEVWRYRSDAPNFEVLSASFDPSVRNGQIRLATNRRSSLLKATLTPRLTLAGSGDAISVGYRYEVDPDTGDFLIRFASAAGTLGDGLYHLSIPAGLFTDENWNPLAKAFTFDFHVLAGDANGDRLVNFDDLLIVAQNYGRSDRTFRQGDFNYSGTVDFDDLLILAQRYGTSLSSNGSAATSAKRKARPIDSVL